MYDMKALYEAASVENAVALRLEHPEAQIIAGGSDVLVQMREGKRAGAELISIYGLDELRGVTLDDEENIRIGSLTSFFGAWLSYYLDGATGGIIVVAQTLLFLITFIFAPKHGLLANRRRAREAAC